MNDLEKRRHSAAHVLATAILRLWPEAQFAAGPPVESGFYYDLQLAGHTITPADFEKIEAEMQKVAAAEEPFVRKVITRDEAAELAKSGRLAALSNRSSSSQFKLDILNRISADEEITIFQNGDFIDLCAGPHVVTTKDVGAIKLTHVSSAFYLGDERNPQLQRIYGTAFATQEELDAHFALLEESKKRDHRRLGKELKLFTFDTKDVGPGMPLWLPNGTVLIEELEKLAKETEFAAGYDRVRTPHLAKESLYKATGHLEMYKDSMYPPIELHEDGEHRHGEDEEHEGSGGSGATTSDVRTRYYLKPMNCPHHHKIFSAIPRSYRDLPIRLAEYGTCYRYEQSGELFGLMRVRSMQMNDAHIYCSADQFEAEFNAVNEMYLKYFKIFGIEKCLFRFSTHDPSRLGEKFVDEPELWEKTESMVRNVLQKSGINYVEVPNEAAFYGPKIDVQVWSAIGREFSLATNQVDFAVPRRLGLQYTSSEGKPETPLCIHRAPLGTHERFIGFLIEHFAGAFPTWLSPEQVRVLPISEKVADYASRVNATLRAAGVRSTVDASADKIGAKIRLAQLEKASYMLVLGPREESAGLVAVRHRRRGDEGAIPLGEFLAKIQTEISERVLN